MHIKFTYLFIISLGLLFFACSETNETENNFNLYLTDCAFEADEINVDIIGVEIAGQDIGNPIEIEANTGIYNLLDFQNGVTTTLATTIWKLFEPRSIAAM